MTRKQAERHFTGHKYDFKIAEQHIQTTSSGEPIFDEPIAIYCATEDATRLTAILERTPGVFTLTPMHPEFLGWTVEEIMKNGPED